MKHMTHFTVSTVLVLALSVPVAYGGPPTLTNLQLPQVDAVFQTFAAATAFRPLEPASAFGKYWGFSLGVEGTATSTSRLGSLLPGQSLPQMPTADIVAVVQAPLGLAAEFGFLPSVSAGGAKFHSFGGDLKWTINEALFPKLPFDIAARVGGTKTGLSYSQSVGPVSDTVSFNSTLIDSSLSLSKKLFYVFEPYVGYGIVHQSSTLSNTGSMDLFNSSVSTTASYSESSSSGHFYGGVQLKLLLFTVTGQYDSMFGVSSESLKFGFKF